RRSVDSMLALKVAFTNFWRGFTHEAGLLRLLLDTALDGYQVVPDPARADLVMTSVHGKRTEVFPEKSIAVIGENVRPDFSKYHYSLSSDFDTYGGRNHRLPQWIGCVTWPGVIPRQFVDVGNNHGYEHSVPIDTLMRPRPAWAAIRAHERFCCFVAGKSEPHRN